MKARERVRLAKLHAKLLDMGRMARMNEEEGRRVGNDKGAAMARGQADAYEFAAKQLDRIIPRDGEI